ncbi:calpain-C [Caerostris extrusa]|uniref:Calpain-C n=1 Tax=Caerostris extrusa TaxID=172846 RepID=A0AAV4VMT4_CAEEX|nr:calpain-C [Caerostris extrusa]
MEESATSCSLSIIPFSNQSIKLHEYIRKAESWVFEKERTFRGSGLSSFASFHFLPPDASLPDLCLDPIFVDDALISYLLLLENWETLGSCHVWDAWQARGVCSIGVVPADQTFSSADYAGCSASASGGAGNGRKWWWTISFLQSPTSSSSCMAPTPSGHVCWKRHMLSSNKNFEEPILVWLRKPLYIDSEYKGQCEEFLSDIKDINIRLGNDQFCMKDIVNIKFIKYICVCVCLALNNLKFPNVFFVEYRWTSCTFMHPHHKGYMRYITCMPLCIPSTLMVTTAYQRHALDEFVTTFTTLEIAHLDGDTSRAESSLKSRDPWHVKLWHGHWQKGVNGGGCRNHSDTFHVNPQMQLIVGEGQDMVICLSQHIVLEPRVIGFSVYQMSKPTSDVLGKSFFKINKSILNSPYSNSRQVSVRCHLEQGYYVLLPTTFEPCQEANYTLRVLSTKPIRMKLLDCVPSSMKPAIIQAPTTNDKVSSYEAVFLRLADEHKTISAFELLELLETCLPNGIKRCP